MFMKIVIQILLLILTSILLVIVDILLLLLLVEFEFSEFDFGPRGGILSRTFDFFETVSVLALDDETYPPCCIRERS